MYNKSPRLNKFNIGSRGFFKNFIFFARQNMARNIIRLAGGTYERLKRLSGSDVLRDREVVISRDTHELYAGTGDGSYELLSNVHIGNTADDILSIDPQNGRLYYSEDKGRLFVANGTSWKKISSSIDVLPNCGLVYNSETGKLELKIDNESIIVDENGNLAVGNTNYGEF